MTGWINYTKNPDELSDKFHELKIISKLGALLDSKKNPFFWPSPEVRGESTRIIKETLCALGIELGYKVYANKIHDKAAINRLDNLIYQKELERWKSGQRDDKPYKPNKNKHYFANREWMYDIHWYEEEKKFPFAPVRVPLVVESEWDFKRPNSKVDHSHSAVLYDFQKLLVANADLRLMIFRIQNTDCLKSLHYDFKSRIKNYVHLALNSKFLLVAFHISSSEKNLFYCEMKKDEVNAPFI